MPTVFITGLLQDKEKLEADFSICRRCLLLSLRFSDFSVLVHMEREKKGIGALKLKGIVRYICMDMYTIKNIGQEKRVPENM